MAGLGTEVGDAYIEVHASTGPFRRELRAEARLAAQDFGKRFGQGLDKAVDSQLTPIGVRIRQALTEQGRLSGEGFADAMEESVIRAARRLDDAIVSAATSGDFSGFVEQFKDMESATKALDKRLGELRSAQEINLGNSNRIVQAYHRWRITTEKLTKAHEDAVLEQKRKALQDKLNGIATRDYESQVKKLTGTLDDLKKKTAEQDRVIPNLSDELAELKKFTKGVDEETEKIARRFQFSLIGRLKGSRNDFLNIVGTMGDFLERRAAQMVKGGFDLITNGIANLGTRLLQTEGPLSGFGATLGAVAARLQAVGAGGIDGLLVQLVAMGAAFQATLLLAGTFAAGLSLLAGAVTALAVTLGGAVLGGLTLLGPLLAGLAVGVTALAVALSGLSDEQKAAFDPLKELFDETRTAVQEGLFQNMGNQIGAVTSILRPFKDVLVAVASATSAWLDQMLAAFSQNGDLQSSLSTLGQALPGLFTSLLTLLSGLGSSLLGLFSAASPAAQLFLDRLNGVVAQFSTWVNSAGGQETINSFLNTALSLMSQLWGIATSLGGTLSILFEEGAAAGSTFLRMIEELVTNFNTWLTDEGGRERLTQWFADSVVAIRLVGDVLGALIALFDTLDNENTRAAFQFILSALTNIINFINTTQQVFNFMAGKIAEGAGVVWGWLQRVGAAIFSVQQAFGNLQGGALGALGAILNLVARIPGMIGSSFGQVGNLLYQAGVDVVNGLRNGIAAAAQGVLNYISSLAGRIASAFKNALGIRSPSRLFAEYGMNIAQGLAQGITASTGLVDSAMGNLIDSSTLSNLNTPVSDLATQGSATSSAAPSAGTVIENGAITVVSPYADPMLVAVEVMDALAVRGK